MVIGHTVVVVKTNSSFNLLVCDTNSLTSHSTDKGEFPLQRLHDMKIYPVFSLGSYITGEQPNHALPSIAEWVSEAHMSTPDFVAIGLAGPVLEVEVLRP